MVAFKWLGIRGSVALRFRQIYSLGLLNNFHKFDIPVPIEYIEIPPIIRCRIHNLNNPRILCGRRRPESFSSSQEYTLVPKALMPCILEGKFLIDWYNRNRICSSTAALACVCVSKIFLGFDLEEEYGHLVFHDDKIDGVSIISVDPSTDEIAFVDWETVVEDTV